MSQLILELWPYVLGAIGIVAGVVGGYMKGKTSAQDKNANELRKQQLESLKKKEEIRNEVEAATDDAIISEFDRLYNDRRRR